MDDTAARARIKIQGDGDEAVLVLRDLLLPSDAFASVIRALGPRALVSDRALQRPLSWGGSPLKFCTVRV